MLYRECKDLNGNKVFEMIKYCDCEKCKNRQSQRKTSNKKYVYFKDVIKKNEAENILNNFKCNGIYSNNSSFAEHEKQYI